MKLERKRIRAKASQPVSQLGTINVLNYSLNPLKCKFLPLIADYAK